MKQTRDSSKKSTENKSTSVHDLIHEALQTRAIRLDLSHQHLTELPESVGELTELQVLELSFNNLMTLPDSIGQLTQLHGLDVSRNQLESLPGAIARLKQLKALDLSFNELETLPETMGQLTRLRFLNLSFNRLKTLPKSIGQLRQLLALLLTQNPLESAPDSMEQLSELRHLSLSVNRLKVLPKFVGRLIKLHYLDLSNYQFQALPDFIGKLTQLETLLLFGNGLQTLPESIGQLTRLKNLQLSFNQLAAMPESMNRLVNLQILNLQRNRLKKLPSFIAGLAKLEQLNLSDNQLSDLPESLWKLGSLTELYLQGNDELGLPQEVLGPKSHEVLKNPGGLPPAKPREILEYYFRVLVDQRPLNEAKLIVVGRGGVGKTCTVNRLVYDRFDRDEEKTQGIQITEWKLQLNGNEDVRLNIWDFGGQEIMHATHQFFLTQRALYLLVLSGREGSEDADAEYWLRLIESFGGDSPVIVVLNKIREHPFDVNRRGLQQKYPVIRDVIKTDCADGIGRDKLLKGIERETDRLEHLRDPFPANWFGIKDRLAGMKDNFLNFDQYREVCAGLGEKDTTAQDKLASYLHSLGIVLNYKDDSRLRDMHVLNARWVTNGIYTILNSVTLEEQKGEIGLNDLPGILKDDEYPVQMHRFLFDLMKKFSLCFSFPDDDARYLIPELLDKQEPEASREFKPEECLNFQYHYVVLPGGLLPRFIVRSHALSQGLPRSAYGGDLGI